MRSPLMNSGWIVGGVHNGAAPNITGKIYYLNKSVGPSGCFVFNSVSTVKDSYSSNYGIQNDVSFDASQSSECYQNDWSRVTPAYVNMKYCIKY